MSHLIRKKIRIRIADSQLRLQPYIELYWCTPSNRNFCLLVKQGTYHQSKNGNIVELINGAGRSTVTTT